MWRIILLATLCICAACSVKQPESGRVVAAYEVPLPTGKDRSEFLALLDQQAQVAGLHLYAASKEDLAGIAKAMPDTAQTVNAAVWRGDDQPEITLMDFADHPGLVWIFFLKGKDPALAGRFRGQALRRVLERWPGTLSLPITPTGGIPLHRDLRRTAHGYELDPAAASKYALAP
jgi:hypothetical protein